MEQRSGIIIRGHCQIWDAADGTLLRDVHNIITCGGCTFMANYLSGGAPTAMSTVAVGSGATAAVTGNTALEAEIGGVDGDRHTAAISAPTTTSVMFSSSYGAGHATGNWYECGVFNSIVAAGIMLCRATFGLLTKAAGDAFIITYTTSFADDGV